MALTKCRECGNDISTAAAACPLCGAPPTLAPKRTSKITWAVLGVIVIAAGAAMLGRDESRPNSVPTAASKQSAEAEYQSKLLAGKRERADAFAKDRTTILANLERLAKAGKWMEASSAANEYYDIDDPAFVKQRDAIEKKISAAIAAKANAGAKREGVRVGMSKEQVLGSSWGKPNSVNKTTSIHGTREQWVYGGNNYLYFEGDTLTTVQH